MAAMPLGVAAAVILIYVAHDQAHGWVLGGVLLMLVWAAIEITLSVKLVRRLRTAKAGRGSR